MSTVELLDENGNITVDWEQFDKLCAIQCTLREIASFFNCSEDTIENIVKKEKLCLFSEYKKKKSGSGKISLRRKQFELALNGNVTMLIWLGKQYLDQSDKDIHEISGIDHEPIIFKIVPFIPHLPVPTTNLY